MAWWIAALCLAMDRVSKVLAARDLSPIGTVPLWEGVFHLTYVENRGAAFGIMQNQRLFLLIVTGLAMCVVVYEIVRKRRTAHILYRSSLGMILGGGLGNLIDRAALGYVVDFFDFRLINFAVFNVADSCVVCGVILLAYYLLFMEQRRAADDAV